MNRFLAISLGAILGANCRYLLGAWLDRSIGSMLPIGTLVINASGSLVLGFFLVLTTERLALSPYWRLLVAVGFLGSYTTFSTFTYETVSLASSGSWWLAFLNALASLTMGFAGAWLGSYLARAI